ncbi:MAG: hypothetical protein E4H26_07140, partial [Flavobacteriales bacterium]
MLKAQTVLKDIDLHAPLKQYFGFSQFKGLQQEVVQHILEQKNTLSSSLTPIVSNVIKPLKSDSESESESESENGSEDDESDTDEVRNIDGMKLNKPYYFQTLIEKKDPILI